MEFIIEVYENTNIHRICYKGVFVLSDQLLIEDVKLKNWRKLRMSKQCWGWNGTQDVTSVEPFFYVLEDDKLRKFLLKKEITLMSHNKEANK